MDMNLILASIGVFLGIILLLVVILLVAKQYLTPSGKVKITINGEKELEVEQGSTLLNTLSVNGIYLSSACGGKGSCGQCKCQVVEGGGEILPSEKGHFSRKQQQDHWRLGCQVKVKGDLGIKIDESVMGVKEWECEVISNKNVATFIKEFIVALPKGEHMDFVPGSYAQIKIPKFEMDYNKDIDKDLLGPLINPTRPKHQLLGVANLSQMRLYYNTLTRIGMSFAIVTSMDGYDEISLTSDFKVMTNNYETIYKVGDLGFEKSEAGSLSGGNIVDDAKEIFDSVLENRSTIFQKNAVIANSAFAIQTINGKSIDECLGMAKESLESGKALDAFKKFVEINS